MTRRSSAYLPAIIRFYLSEPILSNVQTYLLDDPSDRSYVLEHLDSLVVKAVGESGGYGMLIGPHSTRKQREEFRDQILASPRITSPSQRWPFLARPASWKAASNHGTSISGRTCCSAIASRWSLAA
jgi:uncharacterized circularly permuted ATP-grasp superfamily protein